MVSSILYTNRNFRNFGLNGKRPLRPRDPSQRGKGHEECTAGREKGRGIGAGAPEDWRFTSPLSPTLFSAR